MDVIAPGRPCSPPTHFYVEGPDRVNLLSVDEVRLQSEGGVIDCGGPLSKYEIGDYGGVIRMLILLVSVRHSISIGSSLCKTCAPFRPYSNQHGWI